MCHKRKSNTLVVEGYLQFYVTNRNPDMGPHALAKMVFIQSGNTEAKIEKSPRLRGGLPRTSKSALLALYSVLDTADGILGLSSSLVGLA